MISEYEKQYMNALREIYNNGFEDGNNERTNMKTKRLPGIVFRIDVEKEFPILKSKFVAAKTAQREIEWIWKKQSNNINDLKAHIWDSWADENGSINKAYGYQMAKPIKINVLLDKNSKDGIRKYKNQAEFIIKYLKEFPNGRWGVISIWNRNDLSEMNLVPCCHTSTWNLDGGRLNCVLDQRSGDMPYGVPFNTTQYAELMIMLAKELKVKPGILTHVIADAHIYSNQMDGVKLQLSYFDILYAMENKSENVYHYISVATKLTNCKYDFETLLKVAKEVIASKPYFLINAGNKTFFNYDADSCKVENYSWMDKIDFGDVAV